MRPTVIVHGGAFNIPDSYVTRYRQGTQNAALAGYAVFSHCGNALDAVENAVKYLEDDSSFNAGHGSVLNESGKVEMDAIVAIGDACKTGAVTCVRDIAHPVSLARKVMENSPHCLLSGEGAMKFANRMNFETLPPMELITNESVCKSFNITEGTFDAHIQTYMNSMVNARDETDLEEFYKKLVKRNLETADGHDTVGAVAIDNYGNVACATSTGGMPGKMLGRVGDSPIFGCGAYANSFGACSSTGHGESLIRGTVCRDAIQYIENGSSAQDAAQTSLDKMLDLTEGRGGIIIIDKKGDVGYAFNTSSMAWAIVSSDERRCGLRPGENIVF